MRSALLLFQIPALMLLCACVSSSAFATNQYESFREAERVNREGADASLQQSTTRAMQALMELGNQNRPGAMNYGHKSYGHYRTHSDLEVVSLNNGVLYRMMRGRVIGDATATSSPTTSSSGGSTVTGSSKSQTAATGFRRLDPKFLREGEAGKIADEFEKKSGMPRETFLNELASAAEKPIYTNDPNLFDKVVTQFEGFTKKIPNENFRKNVEASVAVPDTIRKGLLGKAVQNIYQIVASLPQDKSDLALSQKFSVAAFATRAPASTEIGQAPAVVGAAQAAPIVADASHNGEHGRKDDLRQGLAMGTTMIPKDSDFKGLENEKFAGEPLGSVMQTAMDEQKEETIFKQISKRYRTVAPLLGLTEHRAQ